MKFTTFYCGEYRVFNTETTHFYAGHCSSGHTYYGEEVKLVRTTKQHYVFRGVKSGVEVKTKRDNLHEVVGKAAKCDIFVMARAQAIIWGENDDYESLLTIW